MYVPIGEQGQLQLLCKVVSPPTALEGDGRAYTVVLLAAVPIGTDNTNRTKMGSITPRTREFPPDRTIGGWLRLQ